MLTLTELCRNNLCAMLAFLLAGVAVFPVMSLPLPNESTEIQLQSLICYQNAQIVWDMLVYLGTNFVAHAASVPTGVETGRYTRYITVDGWNSWAPIVCLFLPFGGLARAIILVTQQLRHRHDDIRAALVHGALLVLARTEKWRPVSGVPELVYAKLPDTFYGLTEDAREAKRTHVKFVFEPEANSHWPMEHNELKLHGKFKVPTGYTLAAPADKAITEHIIQTCLHETNDIKIHRPQNTLKVIASIVQIFSASLAVYATRGSQNTRWGYASYGLYVFPHALMSVMNLISAALIGEYHCGYVLRTPIMAEAERRTGAVFHGSIGIVKEQLLSLGTPGRKDYELVQLLVKESADPGKPGTIAVTVKSKNADVRSLQLVFLPYEPYDYPDAFEIELTRISHNGPVPKEELETFNKMDGLQKEFICVCFLITTTLPYALIYILTRFQSGSSSLLQRGMMLAWLAADQLSSFGTLLSWLIWRKHADSIPIWAQITAVATLAAPAIGGFVVIGQMYLEEKGFSPCN